MLGFRCQRRRATAASDEIFADSQSGPIPLCCGYLTEAPSLLRAPRSQPRPEVIVMSLFRVNPSRRRVFLFGALFVTFAGGQASAQSRGEKDEAPRVETPEYRYDFGLFGGGHFFTSEHILGRSKDDPSTPPEVSPKSSGAFGAHLGFHFNRWIGMEGEAVGIPTRTRGVNSLLDPPSDTQLWVFGYRASFILHLSDNYIVQPFLLAGYGGLTSLSGNSDVVRGDTVGFLHGGAGLKIGFTPWIGLRLDGRILVPWTALSPAIPIGSRIGYTGPDFEVFAGLYVNFGEVEKIQIVDRPRADKDGDGIPDDVDKCPTEPEDKDGFQDDDGCPDPDNDGDGIPDTVDKCPNQPETFNHYQDEDGCPDEVPAAVKKFTGVIEGINFKTNSAEILPGSFAILDRAIKVLQDYPDVNLEISGHTDNRGRAEYNRNLSQRRADSVKIYFVTRGIASSRLQSIGYGMERPIADNSTSSGRATNRRTEFRLIDK